MSRSNAGGSLDTDKVRTIVHIIANKACHNVVFAYSGPPCGYEAVAVPFSGTEVCAQLAFITTAFCTWLARRKDGAYLSLLVAR